MNNYIKYLVEAFDFDSINKQNKTVNAVDTVLKYIILKIDNEEKLSKDDYDLLKNCVGIYSVSNHDELKKLIGYFIKQFGNVCNFNWIDVSNVTDMTSMFEDSKFNGDISQWNVSNVADMQEMFSDSKFNGDISQWDVSNVKNMMAMFSNSDFNGDISQWDVSNVTSMAGMFLSSSFNNDISQWNVSKVIDMHDMFEKSMFNCDISKWDVGNVTDKRSMFTGCPIKKEYKPIFK